MYLYNALKRLGDNFPFRTIIKLIVYLFAAIGFIFISVYFAISFGLTKEKGVIDRQRESFLNVIPEKTPEWAEGEEWEVLKEAIIRDKEKILTVTRETEINPRFIVELLVVEQLRLYHDEREVFEKIFAPLKILGNQSQFSWGVMGIKKETAVSIENNLKDKASPFYLGLSFEHVLDFKTEGQAEERFERITDAKDRYYAYLYSALYVKQILAQWKKAGYDISDRPEIIATLYNIGFNHSAPNENPQSGGSTLNINNKEYSFGSLAGEFYYSQELRKEFP